MKIGVTGTREGMTDAQRAAFVQTITPYRPTVFHHGSCEGADVQAARMVRDFFPRPKCWIVSHPGPEGDPHQEQSGVDDERRDPKKHFARNRDIVDESELVIACPISMDVITKDTRGGTAMTVTYSRKRGKPLCIVWPDGTVTRELSE